MTLNETDYATLDIDQQNTAQQVAQSMYNVKLMALRAQNPFVPIVPIPNSSYSIQLQPGVAADINIPHAAKLAFPSGDQVYYLSKNGQAQVPKVADSIGNGEYGTGSFMNPEGAFLYVEEVRQLSVISPVLCNFTMGFYHQQ